MPEMCKYRRKEIDEARILVNSDYAYPKKIPAKDGTSSAVWIDKDTVFKRKLQDGNHSLNFHSTHHHVYDEFEGTFDDLAEVISYRIAKNLGTRQKVMYDGSVKEVPLVDVAEYDLAIYTNKEGVEYRGCTSKNIVPSGSIKNQMIKGCDLFNILDSSSKPKNSLTNHIKALSLHRDKMQKFSEAPVVVDPNVEDDLIINSYFCWKIGNSDNHSGNILYVQTEQPDGTLLLSLGSMIDNGSGWELSSPQGSVDGKALTSLERMFETKNVEISVNQNGNPTAVFNSDPFKHNAFHLDAGNLNGHSKHLGEEKFEYEFDLAANMLSNQNVYDVIYNVETKFDADSVIADLGKEKLLNYPKLLPETIRGLTQFKSNLLSTVVADYFCYTAFSACVESVDQQNPSELYQNFQQEMLQMPLQPNVESYMQAFLNIADQNQVEVNLEGLNNINFLPKNELTQIADPNEGCNQ